MKINRKELYSIEDLERDEMHFLFEVIEQLNLTKDSPAASHAIAEKFKSFRAQIQGSDIPEVIDNEDREPCDGCEAPTLTRNDPITGATIPLCDSCYKIRNKY